MARNIHFSSANRISGIFLTILLCLSVTGAQGQPFPEQSGKKLVFPSPWLPLTDTVRIVFIGDVMQHGYQIRSARIKGANPDDPDSYDYSATFKYVEDAFRNADLAVANMEFPMGILPYTGYPHFSAPFSIARQAKESGLGLFQLANNHLMDKGEKGLETTLRLYDSLGVPHTGAYRSDREEEEKNPVFFDLKGIRFAFINFTYGTNGNPVPAPYRINLMDSVHVIEMIARARRQEADIIIALPHWGNEYQLYPSAGQKEWARMLFRHGVRIIVGTHPHVPQTGEIHYAANQLPSREEEVEKIVFYSLGNYISNQSIPDYTQLELMAEIRAVKNNMTREVTLLAPQWTYLWCFKKGELEDDYTVVPVEEILGNPEKVKSGIQYERMCDTYREILNKDLIKKIYY